MKKRSSAFLILIIVFSTVSNFIPVNGYNQLSYYWYSDTVNYDDTSLNVIAKGDLALVVANIMDTKIDVTLEDGSGDIELETVYESTGDWYRVPGATEPTYSGTEYTAAEIGINSYYTGSYTSQKRQCVIAHEMLHALGLDHASSEFALMYPYLDDVYDDNEIFIPVFDDIAGLSTYSRFGPKAKTSFYYDYQSSSYGHVDPDPPGGSYPVDIWINPAGTSKYSSVFEQSRYLPDSDTLLMSAKVNCDTLGRYSMGIFLDYDYTDPMMVIEITTAQMKLKNSSGYVNVKDDNGSNVVPDDDTDYWLYLVVQDWEQAYVYVYSGAGGTYEGRADLDLDDQWSSQVYLGHSVYTGSSVSSKPDVTISEWYNPME